jgi:hypothetical protein
LHLAHDYAQMWLDFAEEMDERALIIDPWAADGRMARIERHISAAGVSPLSKRRIGP